MVGAEAGPKPIEAPSRESPGQRLTRLIGEMLAELRGEAAPGVSLDDALEPDLGIDSLARAELVLRMESVFNVRLPEALAAEARTPRDLLGALAAASPRAAIELTREQEAEPPLAEVGEPRQATTLIEALDWHAARHPERRHVTLLEQDGRGEPLCYGELAREARAVAAGLLGRGLEQGHAVAIMLPTSRDFLLAYVGTMMAGGVPVPIYPPFRWTQIEDHLRRQAAILSNCAASLLVTRAQASPPARLLQAQVPSLNHVLDVADLLASRDREAALAACDTALIQYTSGSTGQPKGVVLSHANLLANIRAMAEAARVSSRDAFVSWLPLYHDMGLIGAWLGSLYYGMPLVLMPPQDFLGRPARWLWAIHRHRATISAGPNFAYEMLAARVPDDELRGLDLSSWRLAFNGAEPVRAATLEKFARRFTPYGLQCHAPVPVYGLAEAGLGLTFPPLGRTPLIDRIDSAVLARQARAQAVAADAAAMSVVSCGQPLRGHHVRVVDTLGNEAPERVEGRIEFQGPSATAGYFDNPTATAKLIHGGWLDTGDLGYLAAGELYVTGRVKELIIRGGQHIHPYDLEEQVGALPGVRKGCVAVFGAADAASGTERVVVVAETRAAGEESRLALRRKIAELANALLGVPVRDIVLVGERVILKTSSGKIRRAACRELYERGLLGAAQRPVAMQLVRLALSGLAASGRRFVHLLSSWLFAAYLWSLFALLAVVAAALSLLPTRLARRRGFRGLARAFVALSAMPVRLEGEARLRDAGPAVIVANHSSYCDFILLAALQPAEAAFAAKRSFAAHPILGPLMRRLGVRFLERSDAQRAVEDAHEIAQAVAAGETLAVFPEGTFNRAPGLLDFHMGAFVVAAESGRPVIPVAFCGTRSVLRDGSWFPRRHPIEVFVHAPLSPKGRDWAEAVRLRNEARRIILDRCGEPDAEAESRTIR